MAATHFSYFNLCGACLFVVSKNSGMSEDCVIGTKHLATLADPHDTTSVGKSALNVRYSLLSCKAGQYTDNHARMSGRTIRV